MPNFRSRSLTAKSSTLAHFEGEWMIALFSGNQQINREISLDQLHTQSGSEDGMDGRGT